MADVGRLDWGRQDVGERAQVDQCVAGLGHLQECVREDHRGFAVDREDSQLVVDLRLGIASEAATTRIVDQEAEGTVAKLFGTAIHALSLAEIRRKDPVRPPVELFQELCEATFVSRDDGYAIALLCQANRKCPAEPLAGPCDERLHRLAPYGRPALTLVGKALQGP